MICLISLACRHFCWGKDTSASGGNYNLACWGKDTTDFRRKKTNEKEKSITYIHRFVKSSKLKMLTLYQKRKFYLVYANRPKTVLFKCNRLLLWNMAEMAEILLP